MVRARRRRLGESGPRDGAAARAGCSSSSPGLQARAARVTAVPGEAGPRQAAWGTRPRTDPGRDRDPGWAEPWQSGPGASESLEWLRSRSRRKSELLVRSQWHEPGTAAAGHVENEGESRIVLSATFFFLQIDEGTKNYRKIGC